MREELLTDSDDDFEKLRNVSKSVDDYPEAFVHAIRNSTVKSLLTTSSSYTSCSSYNESKSPLVH